MAKKKKAIESENSVIVNWVNQNESALKEVQKANAPLYTAVASALDYLNKYLGGSGTIVLPEPTVVITKELLDKTFIRIYDFKQLLEIQKRLFEIGYQYNEQFVPSASTSPKFELKNDSDVWAMYDAFYIKTIKQDPKQRGEIVQEPIIAFHLRYDNDRYEIFPMFQSANWVVDMLSFREINVLDLGLSESLIPKIDIKSIQKNNWAICRILLPPIPRLQIAFQDWAFKRRFFWSSGYKVETFTDVRRIWLHKGVLEGRISSYEKTLDNDNKKQTELETTPSVSISMLNIKPTWDAGDFVNTKIQVLNPSRDLPQLKKFFLDLGLKIGMDDSTNPSYKDKSLVIFIYDFEVLIQLRDVNPFDTNPNTQIYIGQLGLPLLPTTETTTTEATEATEAPYSELTKEDLKEVSIYVSDANERTRLEFILEDRFKITQNPANLDYSTDDLLYINIDEDGNHYFTTNKPAYSTLYDLSKFGIQPKYKPTENLAKGDRWFMPDEVTWNYIYGNAYFGKQTFLISRIYTPHTSPMDIELTNSFVTNLENQRDVIWNTSTRWKEEFDDDVHSGAIRIIAKQPIYEEATTVGDVEILQVGYLENENTFLYQIYRKDINSFTSMNEKDLSDYLNQPKKIEQHLLNIKPQPITQPKPKKTTVQKTPTIAEPPIETPKPDVSNLYNELDDLDI